MFGLEKNNKGKDKEEFLFDIEQEWSDAEKLAAYRDNIIMKTDKLKKMLREGSDSEEEQLRLKLLLLGYGCFLKVAAESS